MGLLSRVVLFSLLSGCATQENPPRAHRGEPSTSALPQVTQSELLSPALDVELVPGKSAAWCATMQMAWDTLGEKAGGALTIDSADPLAIDIASQRFPIQWIDKESVLVRAGPLTPAFLKQTDREVRDRFGIAPRLLNNLSPMTSAPPIGLGVFALLHKDLAFPHRFTRSTDQSGFEYYEGEASSPERIYKTVWVQGFEADSKTNPKASAQVKVIWCMPDEEAENRGGPPDVSIELLTAKSDDRLILSQFREPPSTLRETVAAAMQRVLKPNARAVTDSELEDIVKQAKSLPKDQREAKVALREKYLSMKNASERMLDDDSFAMPRIRIDAVRRYSELEGAVTTPGASIQQIALAEQLVSFTLDEGGARLHSESDLGGLFGGPMPRSLSFSRPFLLMLVRRGAPRPYFALWVGGPDVLELSKEQPRPPEPGEGLFGGPRLEKPKPMSDPAMPAVPEDTTEMPTSQPGDDAP